MGFAEGRSCSRSCRQCKISEKSKKCERSDLISWGCLKKERKKEKKCYWLVYDQKKMKRLVARKSCRIKKSERLLTGHGHCGKKGLHPSCARTASNPTLSPFTPNSNRGKKSPFDHFSLF